MYIIGDIGIGRSKSVCYAELSRIEENAFKDFYQNYGEFEKLTLIKNIAKNSILDFSNFIENQIVFLNNDQNREMDFLNYHGTDLIIKFILLNRMYLENIKQYIINIYGETSVQYKSYNKELQTNSFDFIFFRLIRNYAQHFRLPITTMTRSWDVLQQKYSEIKFLITKQDLLKKKWKRHEFVLINKNLNEEVSINDYIDKWIIIINKATSLMEKMFFDSISEDFKCFFKKYEHLLLNFRVINFHENRTYDNYPINKEVYHVIKRNLDNQKTIK